MKKLNLIMISVLSFLLLAGQSEAYSQKCFKTLKVSFINESVSFPFTQFTLSPVNPGISIGTDLMVWDKTPWYRSFGVEVSYYYQRLYEHAILIDAAYSFGYTFNFGLRPKLIGMLGYKHSILTGDTYVQEEGKYVEKQHPGHPQANLKIGFGLEYAINDKVSITADYLGMFAGPYSPKKEMPFSTHGIFRLGAKINIL